MPYFDEQEGIWLLTPAEEKHKSFGGALAHPLTQAERSLGGRSGRGQAKSRKHTTSSSHGRMMALARWSKHKATQSQDTQL